MEPTPDPALPVMSLEYARPVAPPAGRLFRRVGWLLVAVGVADAVAGLPGTPFGLGVLPHHVYGTLGFLLMLLVGWGGSAINVAAGIGLVRRRSWARRMVTAAALYAAGYLILFAIVRALFLLEFGTHHLALWMLGAVVSMLPMVHWAAVPTLAWWVVRTPADPDSLVEVIRE